MIEVKCIECGKKIVCKTKAKKYCDDCYILHKKVVAKEYNKRYRQQSWYKEYHRKRCKIYRDNNKEKVNEANRKWVENNRDKVRAYGRKRYYEDKERSFKYSERYKNLEKYKEKYGDIYCLRCGFKDEICTLDIHHITEDETIVLCSNCHRLVTSNRVRIIEENGSYKFEDTKCKV